LSLLAGGDEIYEREVLPHLGPADEGKLALIDIETADYEIDRDEFKKSRGCGSFRTGRNQRICWA
jgi:hypothetical protein